MTFDELFAEHRLTTAERDALVAYLASLRVGATMRALSAPVAAPAADVREPAAWMHAHDLDLLERLEVRRVTASRSQDFDDDVPLYGAPTAVQPTSDPDGERYRFACKHNLILAGGIMEFNWPVAPMGKAQWDKYLDRAAARTAQGEKGGV